MPMLMPTIRQSAKGGSTSSAMKNGLAPGKHQARDDAPCSEPHGANVRLGDRREVPIGRGVPAARYDAAMSAERLFQVEPMNHFTGST